MNSFQTLNIAILGGGSTLLKDLKSLPGGEVRIGCNHHWHTHNLPIDYMVFVDNPDWVDKDHVLINAINACTKPTISCRVGHSTFVIKMDIPQNSGQFATRWALENFTGQIHLLGMDCRVGTRYEERDIKSWEFFLSKISYEERRRLIPYSENMKKLLII